MFITCYITWLYIHWWWSSYKLFPNHGTCNKLGTRRSGHDCSHWTGPATQAGLQNGRIFRWNFRFGSLKNGHFSHQKMGVLFIHFIHFHRIFHDKPSILGYPHLWKPPVSLRVCQRSQPICERMRSWRCFAALWFFSEQTVILWHLALSTLWIFPAFKVHMCRSLEAVCYLKKHGPLFIPIVFWNIEP